MTAGPPSEFIYDGKTMLAFAPHEDLVAVADAPPTIDAMLKAAYDGAAIYFPFTDVIVADPYGDIAPELKLAFYIGQSHVVGGTVTDMVAVANDTTQAQIWIGEKDKLPRMIRATYFNEAGNFRHVVELSDWHLDPKLPAGTFGPGKAAKAQRDRVRPTRRLVSRNHHEHEDAIDADELARPCGHGPPDDPAAPGPSVDACRRLRYGIGAGGGGSWSASGYRGGSASGSDGSWSGSGFRGGSASGSDGWSCTGGDRGGTASAATARGGQGRHGGTASVVVARGVRTPMPAARRPAATARGRPTAPMAAAPTAMTASGTPLAVRQHGLWRRAALWRLLLCRLPSAATVDYYGNSCNNCGGWGCGAVAAAGAVGLAAGAAIGTADEAAVASANNAAAYGGRCRRQQQCLCRGRGGEAAAAPAGRVYTTLPANCQYRAVGTANDFQCGNMWLQPAYGANGLYYKQIAPP